MPDIGAGERSLRLAGAAERADLAAFLGRALRLDEAAVVRLRRRRDGLLGAWVRTGFEALAVRTVRGEVDPADTCVAADVLRAGLVAVPDDVAEAGVDPGWAMDSAWRGALPPEDGYTHIDDVPARILVDLAQRGVHLTREQGAQGPPTSLLEQEVLQVSSGSGETVGIPMRMVFALGGMGFVPGTGSDGMSVDDFPDDEVVRVRASATWVRLDARYGSVYLRRSGGLGLNVI